MGAGQFLHAQRNFDRVHARLDNEDQRFEQIDERLDRLERHTGLTV